MSSSSNPVKRDAPFGLPTLDRDDEAHYECSSDHEDNRASSPSSKLKGKGSIVSDRTIAKGRHVPIGHFDPEGVAELTRSYSRKSEIGTQYDVASMSEGRGRRVASHERISMEQIKKEPFDFERFLREKIDQLKAEDKKPRRLGVMFQDLVVSAIAPSSYQQATLGSMFSPFSILERIQSKRRPRIRNILSDFTGVLQPMEMLLVLGRPGSGCSTFLKTIANQTTEYHSVTGTRMYDSFTPKEIATNYRGDVTYCGEDDVHFPTLTVAQTLAFAAKTRTPHSRLANDTREDYINLVVEILTTVFGLRHAKNTPVGNASIRGVSGGEKKRVSICEALASRCRLGTWDNSTRGLDSSTALEFVQALRIATDLGAMSTAVSIYQVADSLYGLFDKVCVIYEGRMVYYGRASAARTYFEGLGFKMADRQTVADFLVACTDPNGRIPNPSHPKPLPRTADDFAAAYKESQEAKVNDATIESYRQTNVGNTELAEAYKLSAAMDQADHTSKKSSYMISLPMQVRAVMLRRLQILRGDKSGQLFQTFSFVFQSIIFGTVFYKVADNTSAYFSRGAVLFFSILHGAISSLAEIATLFAQRPVLLRHYKAAMYHPFIDAVALTLVDIPITAATQTVFSLILYFLVGLQQTPKQFFTFWLLVITMTITMKGYFRMMSAAFKAQDGAQAISGLTVLIFTLYTGFTIPKPSMVKALRWINYIDPLRYGFEAILTNEFHTVEGVCSTLIPFGPGYANVSLANQVCTTVGSVSGQPRVSGNRFVELSYGYSYSNVWRNFGILVAFASGFLCMFFWLTEVNISFASSTPVTLFKRGSAQALPNLPHEDEENMHPSTLRKDGGRADQDEPGPDIKGVPVPPPKLTNVFTWHHVNYTVPIMPHGTRKLLDDVSGYVAPGRLTALMGESGAGKTTLLNVLSDRFSTGVVRGERLFDGHPLPSDFQAQSGYVQQMDTHIDQQTVREALLFSAKLRQPESVPLAEKAAHVETCLKMCGLEAYADAIVGTLGVEHRKRTTIGVELAAKPKMLLFLDEPTSGLDSQSAWAIMVFLRRLADSGQAILCTIHQPSGELFQVFDRLLLLRKGGQTVYFGDLGRNCRSLVDFFERNGGRTCDDRENPAEWMLDVIGAGATATSAIDWHDVWKRSPEASRLLEEIDQIHNDGMLRPPVRTTLSTEFATSWTNQLKEMVIRTATCYWRNPTYLVAKLALNIMSGLLIGFTFYKPSSSLQGTQNKLFSIFMGIIIAVPLSNQFQGNFMTTRNVYEVREKPSRMYSWTVFVASQLLIEIPWNIIGSALFFVSWYFAVGFGAPRAGLMFLYRAVLYPSFFSTLSLAATTLAPNELIASLLYTLVFFISITFNGVLQPFSELGWWRWMYRLSPFTYLIEGLMAQGLGGDTITCASQELAIVQPPANQTCGQYMNDFITRAGGYLSDPNATSDCGFCAFKSADQLMAVKYNIFTSHRWRNVGFLVAYCLFNVFLAFLFTYLFRVRHGSLLGWLRNLRHRTVRV